MIVDASLELSAKFSKTRILNPPSLKFKSVTAVWSKSLSDGTLNLKSSPVKSPFIKPLHLIQLLQARAMLIKDMQILNLISFFYPQIIQKMNKNRTYSPISISPSPFSSPFIASL